MLVLGDMFIDGTDATGTHARHGGPYETRACTAKRGLGWGDGGNFGASQRLGFHTRLRGSKLQASVGFLESIKSLGFWT